MLDGASGFLYYVSIAGVTGTKDFDAEAVESDVRRLKARTALRVGVGFGIKTKANVATIARFADAAVVGSAIVARIAANLDGREARAAPGLVDDVAAFVAELASGARGTAEEAGLR